MFAVEPLRRLADVQGQLQRVLASAERVHALVDLEETESGGTTRLPRRARGALRFEGVRFRHRRDVPLLEGVDLAIAPGETVGIVAASGGGKSTLASLLPRLLDPVSGRVLLDGIDLRTLALADLRRGVCVVEQEPVLFGDSIAENVRFGTWDATDEAVEEAPTSAVSRSWWPLSRAARARRSWRPGATSRGGRGSGSRSPAPS